MTKCKSQLTTQNSKLKSTAILAVIALAFALNLHALAGDSFWGDEILTAMFASQSPAKVIRWTAADIHPPLYYLLAGAFTRLTVPLGLTDSPTAASDWLWRFPSLVAGVLTVAMTYRLALHVSQAAGHAARSSLIAHRSIATAAGLLLTLAPIAIKYGQEARMHALFMFLSALSTLLFFRAMARPRQWTRWLAFALATTANIYTMYFGFLILAAQASFVVFTIYDLRFTNQTTMRNTQYTIRSSLSAPRLVGFPAAAALALLLYLPWWPVLLNILRKRAAVGAIEGGVGQPLDFGRGVVQALGPLPEPVAWGFFGFFVLGVVLLAHRYRPLAGFAALWLGLPVALPLVLGDPRALQFRYAFVLPVYLIVIAYALVQIGRWRARKIGRLTETNVAGYLLWVLATLSFIATLGIYQQTKPDWRGAAAYLDEHTAPADIILIGPLWDEGRFIDYYYRGQAQLLTPAALVTNIERRAESLRSNGGRVWAVNRFKPAGSPVMEQVVFAGVVISEPTIPVYEPALLTEAAIDLARQAVDAAYPWAAAAEAQGVLDPDPRTAQAAALRALGDTLVAAGRPQEALTPYQTAVDIFPGWVNGFLALAETQELVGNLPAAAAAYRQAVAFNLNWHGPPADAAAALIEAGQWDAALAKYHQIIEGK
jgi:tetratricopeptide (TPR) repeat protein